MRHEPDGRVHWYLWTVDDKGTKWGCYVGTSYSELFLPGGSEA